MFTHFPLISGSIVFISFLRRPCIVCSLSPPVRFSSSMARHERSRGVAAASRCAAPANLFEDLGGRFVVAVPVVPIPPLIRRRLRVGLRRVLPFLLTPEGSDVQVVPSVPHLLVTAVVDEVCAEHTISSRMNAFVPCHSSTPKSLSKSSVSVYQGMNSQPICAVKRLMSFCGARDANTRVVSRAFKWAG